MNTLQILVGAAHVLADPSSFNKGHYSVNANRQFVEPSDPQAVCFCTLGATYKAECIDVWDRESEDHLAAMELLAQSAVRLYPERISGNPVPTFNDHPDTTHADVLKVINHAIDQHIFNTVWSTLTEQGRPALNQLNSCMYRAPDGCKCAVGQLIPDERYTPECEGEGVTRRLQSMLPFDLTQERVLFLRRLQSAHDNDLRRDVDKFHDRMRSIAKEYNLCSPSSPADPAK